MKGESLLVGLLVGLCGDCGGESSETKREIRYLGNRRLPTLPYLSHLRGAHHGGGSFVVIWGS